MSEHPKAFFTKTRKARKFHICCECKHGINKGDSYQFTSGVWDEPASFKQCLDCNEIMQGAMLASDNGGDGVNFGEMREYCLDFMCSDFEGSEFIAGMASDFGVTQDQMKKLLSGVDLN